MLDCRIFALKLSDATRYISCELSAKQLNLFEIDLHITLTRYLIAVREQRGLLQQGTQKLQQTVKNRMTQLQNAQKILRVTKKKSKPRVNNKVSKNKPVSQ